MVHYTMYITNECYIAPLARAWCGRSHLRPSPSILLSCKPIITHAPMHPCKWALQVGQERQDKAMRVSFSLARAPRETVRAHSTAQMPSQSDAETGRQAPHARQALPAARSAAAPASIRRRTRSRRRSLTTFTGSRCMPAGRRMLRRGQVTLAWGLMGDAVLQKRLCPEALRATTSTRFHEHVAGTGAASGAPVCWRGRLAEGRRACQTVAGAAPAPWPWGPAG